MTFALLLAAYLFGAVPASYLAGRWLRGIDLRQHGSGNLGATNAFRVLGPGLALPVLLFDLAKGFLPTWFFPFWDGAGGWEWALAYGAAAVTGHVFPLFLGFKGGKGVATATGVFVALSPLAVGMALLVWGGVLVWRRTMSLASIAGATFLVPALLVVDRRPALVAFGAAVAALVVYAHRENIRRLLRGEELTVTGTGEE